MVSRQVVVVAGSLVPKELMVVAAADASFHAHVSLRPVLHVYRGNPSQILTFPYRSTASL